MNIKKGTITVNVSDVEASLKFCSDILGFRIISNYGNESGKVQGHGLTIGLRRSNKMMKKNDSQDEDLATGLEVEDLDSSVSELNSKGVVFVANVFDDGRFRIAMFQDLDRNPLYLSQMKKEIR